MLLSYQTREGLKITGKHNSANLLLNLCSQVYINLFPSVNSFVEMTQFLLSVPGVQYVLSEKLCQQYIKPHSTSILFEHCLTAGAGFSSIRTCAWQLWRQCSTSSSDMFGKQNDLGIPSIEFLSYCKCTSLWHGIFIIHTQSMTLL